MTDETKWCPGCRRMHPITIFKLRCYNADGMMAQCQACLGSMSSLSGFHDTNIREVTEGPIVGQLAYVFKQLEALGVKRRQG